MDRLAASHARAAQAIAVLHSTADVHRDRSHFIHRVRQSLRRRIAKRLERPLGICFALVLLALALFLGWVSYCLVTHLAPAPFVAAVLPGVLVAAATAGAARFTKRSAGHRAHADPASLLFPVSLLVAACAGVGTLLSLWLILTTSTGVWATAVFALCFSLAAAVALTTCSQVEERPGGPATIPVFVTPAARMPPRRLQAKDKRARGRLDDHTRHWTTAAQRYAVTIPSTSHPKEILANLLAGDVRRFPVDGLEPFDVLILSGLLNYHPAGLAADLRIASAKLKADIST